MFCIFYFRTGVNNFSFISKLLVFSFCYSFLSETSIFGVKYRLHMAYNEIVVVLINFKWTVIDGKVCCQILSRYEPPIKRMIAILRKAFLCLLKLCDIKLKKSFLNHFKSLMFSMAIANGIFIITKLTMVLNGPSRR